MKIINKANSIDTMEKQQGFGSLKQAFSVYFDLRTKQIALAQSLTPAELSRQARHPEYEEYSIVVLLHHMVFHEYWHMYRVEELWLTRDEYFI
ncbi:MAG: hypothetical protein P8107_08005 [Spirochaetia bacterium]